MYRTRARISATTDPSFSSSPAESRKPALQVGEREVRQLRDRPAAESHRQSRRAEASSPAVGASSVGAVTGEQDPDMDLVALGLEPVEEPRDPVELSASAIQDFPLVWRKVLDRHVRPDRVASAGAEEIAVGG